MVVIGIDPSSTKTGIAIFEDRRLKFHGTYTTDKKLELPHNILNYSNWLIGYMLDYKPDLVVIETAHSRILNVNTFKKIAYYESASMLSAMSASKAEVILLGAAAARKSALGKGNYSKEESGKLVDKLYPKTIFGSPDEKDAVVLALAGLKRL